MPRPDNSHRILDRCWPAAAARPLLAAGRRACHRPRLILGARRPCWLCVKAASICSGGPGRRCSAGAGTCRSARVPANVRMQMDDKDGAAADAAEAVILDRRDPVASAAWRPVAELVAPRRRPPASARRFPPTRLTRLIAKAWPPRRKQWRRRRGLGDARRRHRRHARRRRLRNAAILLSVRRRDFTIALRLAERGRLGGMADACTFGLRGHALSILGRHAEAGGAYAEALKLGPKTPTCAISWLPRAFADTGARTSIISGPCSMAMPIASSSSHIAWLPCSRTDPRSALCSIPRLSPAKRLRPVLDLGCGTGLLASCCPICRWPWLALMSPPACWLTQRRRSL